MTERKAHSASRQIPLLSPERGRKQEEVLQRLVSTPMMKAVFTAESDAKIARLRLI